MDAVADVMRKLGDASINTAAAASAEGGGRYGMVLGVAHGDPAEAARAPSAPREPDIARG